MVGHLTFEPGLNGFLLELLGQFGKVFWRLGRLHHIFQLGRERVLFFWLFCSCVFSLLSRGWDFEQLHNLIYSLSASEA